MLVPSWLRRFWVLVAAAIVIVPAAALFAASAGPSNPGTCVGVYTDSTGWTTPENAVGSNNSYAFANLVFENNRTDYLACTNFGFSIPNGAVIDGIQASIERHAELTSLVGGVSANGNGAANTVRDLEVYILKDGDITGALPFNNLTPGGDNKFSSSNWPFGDTVQDYGGSTDLWNRSFTPSDINSSGFGAALSVVAVNSTFTLVSGGSAAPRVSPPSSQSATRSTRVRTEGVSAQVVSAVSAFVDVMQITVFYTERPTATSTATATATATATPTSTATATPTATSKRTTATRIPGPSQTRTSQAPRTTATPRPAGAGLAEEGWRAPPSR